MSDGSDLSTRISIKGDNNLSFWCVIFDSGPPLQDDGGPTPTELIHLIDQCDLSNSRHTTPSVSPAPQLMSSVNTAPVAGASTPQSLRRQFLSDGCDQPACFSGGANVTSSAVSDSTSAFVPRSVASGSAVSSNAASLAAGFSAANSGSNCSKTSHVDGNSASNKHWELLSSSMSYICQPLVFKFRFAWLIICTQIYS